ncbi:MAG: hypothetical protein MUC97_06945 [Bernardetiaceae bacterium]|nr:hypothetical protein [Bernardetiaceae bacterium]
MRYLHLFLILGLAWAGHSCASDSFSVAAERTVGQGGSMARFAIVGNTLYTVDNTNLRVFNIGGEQPLAAGTVPIGNNIETIFPMGQNLFVGSPTTMYVYNVTDPLRPVLLSSLPHVTGTPCFRDPVVVQGNYAYATLRAETRNCGNTVVESILSIMDISDLRAPRAVHRLSLTSPYGLGLRGNALFVCEGKNGLRVFDLSNPTAPAQRSYLPEVKSYDVIPLASALLLIGEDGFYQYDYSDLRNLRLLSKIPVTR